MPRTYITPASLTKDKHQTIKQVRDGICHYAVVVNERVIASLELGTSLCGNYWVRHSASEVSNQGYGFALYQLAMQDVYPKGVMPSRECTSGHAVSLWEKIYKQEKIKQTPIVNPKVYCTEFDEWLDEITEVNPSLDEDGVVSLEKDFSYLNAVQEGLMKPHPYNSTYHLKPEENLKITKTIKLEYFQEAAELFNRRYDNLDL